MKNIAEIDKNLKVDRPIYDKGMAFRNITSAPFSVHGLIREDGHWCRMPDAIAQTVNPGVHTLARHTAGGRVRFRTDATTLAIRVNMPAQDNMCHMPLTGQTGFDVYIGDGAEPRYVKTFIPPIGVSTEYEAGGPLFGEGMRTVTVNFPLYHAVNDLYIGTNENAMVEAADDYAISLPIVYYGSSITQGGCASRPGNSYQGFISRALDADYINLGFSGNARGEEAMARYIASLDMSAFVYDYDHNATTPEKLEETHEPFFKIIRAAHPELPIVFMTRPAYLRSDYELKRKRIIETTYNNAIAAADKNVYFIDGRELMELCGNNGTVDGCHPTDLGFYSMAQRLLRELKKIF